MFGLDRGHLLYASGHGTRVHTVRRAGIEIRQHVLDLELSPAELLEQVDAVAAQLVT